MNLGFEIEYLKARTLAQRPEAALEKIDRAYMKGLTVIASVLLKGPLNTNLEKLWRELPHCTSTKNAKQILDQVFNSDNLDAAALPIEVQTIYTHQLLTGEGRIEWDILTEMALDLVIRSSKDLIIARQAQTAKTWLTSFGADLSNPEMLHVIIATFSSRSHESTAYKMAQAYGTGANKLTR